MSGINDSSKKIADIIGVIEGIAFQTNILALNATVEAARAGEQGRGFAVVAGEVRSLAQRSATAAKEIKELISDSVDRVENGSTLVTEAGGVIDEVEVAVKRVTDIMCEISAASDEQSAGIEQVNQTVTRMDEVTQQNAALVEEAATAVPAPKASATVSSASGTVANLAPCKAAVTTAPATPALRAARKLAAAPAKQVPAPSAASAVTTESDPIKLALAAVSSDACDWEQF